MSAVAFYGACPTCGAGAWADVETGGHAMLGPTLTLVCQHHLPVAEIEAVNEDGMSADLRQTWTEWRRAVLAEEALRQPRVQRPSS